MRYQTLLHQLRRELSEQDLGPGVERPETGRGVRLVIVDTGFDGDHPYWDAAGLRETVDRVAARTAFPEGQVRRRDAIVMATYAACDRLNGRIAALARAGGLDWAHMSAARRARVVSAGEALMDELEAIAATPVLVQGVVAPLLTARPAPGDYDGAWIARLRVAAGRCVAPCAPRWPTSWPSRCPKPRSGRMDRWSWGRRWR
ncbi:hypothetical protein [Salipiger mucosus]|uniref:Peptidase S8/S53 domain-containing protein n=1 Tax=Salipiger mucosus DSM 16094 TaxID=1123237 RepID=S9Q791_9RHOB|nr:hypothetical protein [Salipiger mucosus]EPX75902.1 hypothetical protein Salmuc_01005 [Salipiger mucosus DSM 16094]